MSEPTRIKADIIPYTAEYSGVVRSWIDCPETYRLVCRGTKFPPPDEIIDSWQRKGVSAYILFSDRKPVAYGELWDRRSEQAVEISHVMVDNYRRSRGYGTKLIELLYNRAATRPGTARVMINLYHQSLEALGCYVKAGFELAGTTSHVEGLRMTRLVKK